MIRARKLKAVVEEKKPHEEERWWVNSGFFSRENILPLLSFIKPI
jgi:hypothetical protein